MALARIYSCSPDQASALIQDLEQRGYTVEVLRPEETPSSPADLEIQYELCDSNGAMERAQELAAQLGADVAIETGALYAVRFEGVPEIVQANSSAAPVARIESLKDVEAAAGPVVEENTQVQERTATPIEGHEVPAALLPEVELGAGGSEPRSFARIWSRGAVAFIAFAGNSMDNLQALWLAGLQKMREQREKAGIRAVEVSARREQKLLELTCQRAEALQRARQLEAARRAAAGYMTQLQRETGAIGPAESTPAGSLQEVPSKRGRGGFLWKPSQDMKNIAAGAAAAGALFALTLGISALRSKPPTTSVNPHAPVVAPTQVTVENRRVVAHETTARPSPAVRKPAQKSASPSVARAQERTHDSAQADDGGADDVVVRHFATPKTSQKLQSKISGGVKRYSDLD